MFGFFFVLFEGKSDDKRPRTIRFADDVEISQQSKKPKLGNHSSTTGGRLGLYKTVKEMVLDNYKPAERIPFYCRLCR